MHEMPSWLLLSPIRRSFALLRSSYSPPSPITGSPSADALGTSATPSLLSLTACSRRTARDTAYDDPPFAVVRAQFYTAWLLSILLHASGAVLDVLAIKCSASRPRSSAGLRASAPCFLLLTPPSQPASNQEHRSLQLNHHGKPPQSPVRLHL